MLLRNIRGEGEVERGGEEGVCVICLYLFMFFWMNECVLEVLRCFQLLRQNTQQGVMGKGVFLVLNKTMECNLKVLKNIN